MEILLLDADGVALKRHEYFSVRYCREYDVPMEVVLPFFKNEFRMCQIGKADLKEEVSKYLPKWKWEKSVDEFLEYWFTTDTEIDEEVLTLIEQFRKNGVRCYLTTDQEKYRAHYIREKLNLNTRLDGCFFSCELGYQKSQPEYFTAVTQQLNTSPEHVIYFDDDQQNVDTAKSIGIDGRFFNTIQDLKQIL